MIFNELHTGFVFYTDIDMQNRFKSNCAALCDYALICRINNLLPFQFRMDYDIDTVLSIWYIRCKADDSIVVDMGVYSSFIDIDNVDGLGSYVSYDGTPLSVGPIFFELACGEYYIEIIIENSEGQHTFFSELFRTQDKIRESAFFAQSPFPVYSAWRWYDREDKLTEANSPCKEICTYMLMCGNDALLPFQYMVPVATSITSWELIGEDCTFPLDHALLTIQTVGSVKNIIYNGDLIDLPCGKYYSQMVIDGNIHYSEPIWISNNFETASTNYILQEDGDKLLQEDNFGLLHS